MEKNFIKVHTTKDYIISFGLVVAGIVLIFLPTPASINFLGSFFILAGALMVFVYKSAYKNVDTGENYRKSVRFFSKESYSDLIKKVESNPSAIELMTEDCGNAVKLDIYYSDKSGKAYLQLFEFVPYQYEARTGLVECLVAEISKIK